MFSTENLISVLPQVVVAGAVVVATVIDIRSYRIPNLLTFSMVLSGLLFHVLVGGFEGLQFSLLGAGAGFLILVWFFVTGVMGAGDVKLLAGVGAWLGAHMTFYVFGVAGLATGVYSLWILASCGRVKTAWLTFQVWFVQAQTLGKHLGTEDRIEVLTKQTDRRRRLIPFALMVTIGVVVVVFGEYQGLLGIR